MLTTQVQTFIANHADYAPLAEVIEKEMLHHDIMAALVQQGVMSQLTFIGGTSLRMCYNSSRLSEDLDFNAGHGFTPSDFDGLEDELKQWLERKYEVPVWVNKPSANAQGDTSSWTISIEKQANRSDLPRQKIHIDVCAIPSFDAQQRMLINHYNMVVPTEGLLLPVQSLEETFADKFIALAYRSGRIKPRDLWDIVWIRQRGISLSAQLVAQKLNARQKTQSDFIAMLTKQIDKLLNDPAVRVDFNDEMSRFIPLHIKQRTVDNPAYWPYLQQEVASLASQLLIEPSSWSPFDMSN
jgi:predicted nucleotidyltransferase component of viral defense system